MRCAPRCQKDYDCPAGTCRQLTAGGNATMVCDLRLPDDSPCSESSECLSGMCTNKKCFPVGGAANGKSCASGRECKSGNCINSICKGKALIGDACVDPYDCSVGTCCPTGKCATTC
jgi:hypothetical protein